MLPCVDPTMPNPETATDREVATYILDLGQAYYDCKVRQGALATWVRGK